MNKQRLCVQEHTSMHIAGANNIATDLRDAPGKQDCCDSYAKSPTCLHELNYVLPASFAFR